jgi:hypothetical protein
MDYLASKATLDLDGKNLSRKRKLGYSMTLLTIMPTAIEIEK